MNSPLTLLVAVVGLNLVGCEYVPPTFQVLSPSEFNIIVGEDAPLLAMVEIKDEIGSMENNRRFESTKIDGRIVHFSQRALDLKKGDRINYNLVVVDARGKWRIDTGIHVFDGVFEKRSKREIYEYVFEGNEGLTNFNQHDRPPRYEHGPGHGHGHDGPHHFNPHGPPATHHFAPHPHHHPPPHGHGAWKGHGDHFGNDGPWDGHNHDGMGCDNHGGNSAKYPSRPDNKPWGEDPYQGNDRFDNPYGEKKPNKNDNNDNNRKDKTTENPNVEVFTTKRPSTTQRTTTVPDIDIRFRVPEDS